MFPELFDRTTSLSSMNSDITCKQSPHGIVKFLLLETMVIFSKSLCPSDTALKIAVRSAHFVAPYELFSMLQLLKTSPLDVKSVAPTLNSEYGEYENSFAS